MSKYNIPKKKITRESLQNVFKLYRFIKPYRIEYAFGLFFLLGTSIANLFFPKLLGDLVNSGNDGILQENLTYIGFLLIITLLVQSIFSYFKTILFVNVTEKTLAFLRQYTFNHLIKLPIKFFEQHRVGELNSRISADISLLQETLTITLAEFLGQIITIIGGISLLMITSFKLTLFMLSIVPAIVLLSVIFGRFVRKFSKQVQYEVAESNTIVEEVLQGIQSVKAYTNEYFEILRYKTKTAKIAQVGMRIGKYRGAFSAFLISGLFGAIVAVIWKGATLLSAGKINAGELFSFVIYSGYIGGNIGGLASLFARIQRFIGATEDLFEIFKEKEEEIIEITDNIDPNDELKGNIEFKNLTFSYSTRANEAVLKNISLSISEKQLIAIVGSSGSGKTTIASLLLQLHSVKHGQILFDGQDSSHFPISLLRHQISIVPQDIFLFGGTILENIAYGKPNATEDEIIEAAKQANALEFINCFPDKFNTIVGERGTQLSGGQRQRIAIARAILKKPKILILDEATSALDSESECLVQEALEKLMKGRTSIIIAHRLSTIRKADRIFVIEKGELVEQGTHEELMHNPNGFYKNLSVLQYGK